MAAHRRVLTIPTGVPFLTTLADALCDGRLLAGASFELADVTVYLPTRRAARTFAETLAERQGGRAVLLPRIVPLGDVDQSEFELAAESLDEGFAAADVLPPPIAPLERRLILGRLIREWAEALASQEARAHAPKLVPTSAAAALRLAADLEALMDALAVHGIPWSDIGQAVDAGHSEYFKLTLDFLRIALENWPKILEERGASDPALRRDALIRAEAQRLLRERPTGPVIAAGSTGSIPATATLLAAIAALPNGAVVLPGLDTDLDEEAWTAVGQAAGDGDFVHGHPQAVMRRLLSEHLGISRAEVATLGTPPTAAHARARVLGEALRPANTTHGWAAIPAQERAALAHTGLDGVAVVEAADEREEALAAALALREAAAEPDRTAALVTPDRALAMRVAADLARWDLAVDDSAGQPLADSQAGRLARLAAEAAEHAFHPARVLALLAHPDLKLGLSRTELERGAAALEIGVLRGPAPAPGLDGLRRALQVARNDRSRHLPRPRRRLSEADWALAMEVLRRLAAAFQGFAADPAGEELFDLVALSERHRQVVHALCEEDEASAPEEERPDYEALERLYDDLAATRPMTLHGRFADYPPFFAVLAAQQAIVPRKTAHPRIRILGLLEARLLSFDRVVLGGLDEGVWPPRAETDAFLNRPMRARLGLPPPEQRIGQTAHDFVQLCGAREVVITRAAKRQGSPMVPSRFLQRLKAFAGGAWERACEAGERYRRLAQILDAPRPTTALRRPAPKPDPRLFPRSLSVTEVETLVRDPYAIFARHVLKLDPLDPVAAAPSAAERGTLIHDILGRFAAAHPQGLPADAGEDLRRWGAEAFAPLAASFPKLYAEWWPRFQRLAAAFLAWERDRRPELAEVVPEVPGALTITLPSGEPIILRARADRIERRSDGSFVIVDFKTGGVPSDKEVFAGFAPQLTLEAAMLMEGAFLNLPAANRAPTLLYVQSTGGAKPLRPREIKPPTGDPRSVEALIVEHRRRLEELIHRYCAGEASYVSRPFPKYARKYSAYDHLARVKEWSLASAGAGADDTE